MPAASASGAPVIDLDCLRSWPPRVVEALEATWRRIAAERDAYHRHLESGAHWLSPAPPRPAEQALTALILQEAAARELRVFHATRLLAPQDVTESGLRPLVIRERLDRLAELAASWPEPLREQLRSGLGRLDVTAPYYAVREGQVWFTPLRRYLHDGGCDVFLEHWGGEAIQRIASRISRPVEAMLRSHGTPAVVVASIPALGWCRRSVDRLPLAMITLYLAAQGHDAAVEAWDVVLQRPVPPERIECVVAPGDSRVSWPVRSAVERGGRGTCGIGDSVVGLSPSSGAGQAQPYASSGSSR